MSQWEAEAVVSEELAAELIRAQIPALRCERVERISEGWDYVVHRVDDEWAFRFPRRPVVVPRTEREIATLPRLAPRLPIAIPEPVHVGRPSDRFGWPFYGARWIPGAEPHASLPDDARVALARPLARALRALHAPELLAGAGADLPFDPIGRADASVRVPRTRASLDAIAPLWEAPAKAEELLHEAMRLAPPEPRAVCHGDLHFRQLVVEGRELKGIVDWVDLCRSDPGVDLSLAWSFLPPLARDAFFDEYGELDDSVRLRAQLLALNLMAILLRYGQDEGNAAVVAEARAGLDRVFAQ